VENFYLREINMRRYICVGVGGILGSLSRYLLSILIGGNILLGFPVNTFIINISGCLFLGFFLTMALEFIEVDSNLRLLITTGFIGSYTTFSTFTNEINTLVYKNSIIIPMLYFASSLVFGVLSIWLGTIAARRIFCRGSVKEKC
jgi:CrcB protein